MSDAKFQKNIGWFSFQKFPISMIWIT